MKKTNRALEGFMILVMVLPLLYLLMVYPALPDMVPTHFDIDGNADDYSSKSTLPLAILLMQGFLYLLMKYSPNFDPKKNFDRFDSLYQKLRVIFQIFMALLSVVIIYSATDTGVDIRGGLVLSITVLIVFLGNYLQNVKPNYFIGIRTPWALESEMVWSKTNRLVGRIWFYGGLALLAILYFLPNEWNLKLLLALTLGSSLFGFVYSYLIFKKEKEALS